MKDKIEQLIAAELKSANEKFPPFASRHEGAAVLLEEVEEACQEVEALGSHYNMFWLYVKVKGEPGELHDLVKMREKAVRLAGEAIQVAAMCDKYLPLLESTGQEDKCTILAAGVSKEECPAWREPGRGK